jgi:hypothetical protein
MMVYSCGQLPAMVTLENVIAGEESQTSVAVALPVLPGNVLAEHEIVTLAGQVIKGATLSATVMT